MAKNEYIRTIPNDYSSYAPLEDNEIRVLRVLGGVPVTCELFRVKISDGSPFSALSYCWGDLGDTRPINLVFRDITLLEPDSKDTKENDLMSLPAKTVENFQVTVNLHNALKSFQSSNFQGLLWADMLCINQDNVTERSSQVSIMQLIYESALGTEIWLGGDPEQPSTVLYPEDDLMTDSLIINVETDTALAESEKWFQESGHEAELINSTPERFASRLSEDTVTRFVWTSIMKSGILPEATDDTSHARRERIFEVLVGSDSQYFEPILYILRHIFKIDHGDNDLSNNSITTLYDRINQLTAVDWFRRIWVIQEVVYSRETYIRHSRTRIKWSSLLNLLRVLYLLRAARWIKKNLWDRREEPDLPLLWTQGLIPPMLPHWKPEVTYMESLPFLSPLEVIFQTSAFKATDPRDRLFGILSLIPAEKKPLRYLPDYAKSRVEVSSSFTKWYFECFGSWDVLSLCYPSGQKRFIRDRALPSWTINLGMDYGTVPPFALLRLTDGSPMFSAGLVTAPRHLERHGPVAQSQEQRVPRLFVHGCIVARVAGVWALLGSRIPWLPNPRQWANDNDSDAPGRDPFHKSNDSITPLGLGPLVQAMAALDPRGQRVEPGGGINPERWQKAMAAHAVRIFGEMWDFFYRFSGLEQYRKNAAENRQSSTDEDVSNLRHIQCQFEGLIEAISCVSRLEICDVAALVRDGLAELDEARFPNFCKTMAAWLAKGTGSVEYLDNFVHHAIDWKLFATNDGRIGIGHINVVEGDSVVVIYGASTPYVVRTVFRPKTPNPPPVEDWKLIGECYLGGRMRGELMDDALCDDKLSANPADLAEYVDTADEIEIRRHDHWEPRSAPRKQILTLV